MVNKTLTSERGLALGYAPPEAQAGMAALLALDATLGGIVRSTSQPIVGQMRLTWWHAALVALDTTAPPAEPVLRALHETVLPHGVTGTELATMIDGWEVLLDDTSLDGPALDLFGRCRGGTLFASCAQVCGAQDPRVEALGAGWALADLARNLSDADAALQARQMADEQLSTGLAGSLPRRLRALGALAILARFDLAGRSPPGSPRRVARLLTHRLTGR